MTADYQKKLAAVREAFASAEVQVNTVRLCTSTGDDHAFVDGSLDHLRSLQINTMQLALEALPGVRSARQKARHSGFSLTFEPDVDHNQLLKDLRIMTGAAKLYHGVGLTQRHQLSIGKRTYFSATIVLDVVLDQVEQSALLTMNRGVAGIEHAYFTSGDRVQVSFNEFYRYSRHLTCLALRSLASRLGIVFSPQIEEHSSFELPPMLQLPLVGGEPYPTSLRDYAMTLFNEPQKKQSPDETA